MWALSDPGTTAARPDPGTSVSPQQLDRLRSRIMQTTFNSNNNLNNKPIISEITDSDILEALQVEGGEG